MKNLSLIFLATSDGHTKLIVRRRKVSYDSNQGDTAGFFTHLLF